MVVLGIDGAVRNGEHLFRAGLIVHVEVVLVSVYNLVMSALDDFLTGGFGFFPHVFAHPFLGIEIQFRQKGVCNTAGNAAVVFRGGLNLQFVYVFRDFLLDEIEHELAVFLGRILLLALADGERNIAPLVHSAHVEIRPEDFYFRNYAVFCVKGFLYTFKCIKDIIAGGHSACPVFPGHFQKTVAGWDAMDVDLVVTALVPPTTVGVYRGTDFVGYLDVECPETLFRTPVLEG